jgi:hypothetical protein
MFGGGAAPGGRDKRSPLAQSKKDIAKQCLALQVQLKPLLREEQALAHSLRTTASSGKHCDLKVSAEKLVKVRHRIAACHASHRRFDTMRDKINQVSDTAMVGKQMEKITQAMASLNRETDMASLVTTVSNYERQEGLLESKHEMLSDVLEDLDGDQDADALILDAIADVFSEFSIQVEVVSKPTPDSEQERNTVLEDSLEKRLALLRA